MHLSRKAFEQVIAKAKTVEIRVNDQKRRLLRVGDIITFVNCSNQADTISVVVTKLAVMDLFVDLFREVLPSLAGWPAGTSPRDAAIAMQYYYTLEEEREFGVVAIFFERV
ncbi:hypothetical protein A2450_03340 [candidate division WWE3 bacterium RIFOXYC2_FULL_40_11]|nr:MAG: hypothetical protein A2450_03340 [candidate division WWE3 bacterium RIFOXYC2_FULL_40_11]